MKRRNSPQSGTPNGNERVKVALISFVGELQLAIQAVMRDENVSASDLAKGLSISDARVEWLLENPEVPVEELVALGLILGVQFKVTTIKVGRFAT